MGEAKTSVQEPTSTAAPSPSSPLFCGAFTSSGMYSRLSGPPIPRAEIDEAIASDSIRWRRRWFLWPFGYGAWVEWRWPALRRRAAHALFNAWKERSHQHIETWGAELNSILEAGKDAEKTVQVWLDRLGKGDTQMRCWLPAWSGLTDIVFPPSDTNDSSHELDNLLVTEHGVYIIEVKNWRKIDEDGTGMTKEGKQLGSPLKQSVGKKDRLRSILGPKVPIYLLAALPRLSVQDTPFGLDARIVNSEGQLQLLLRTAQQKCRPEDRIDVEEVRRSLLPHMDQEEGAKLRHMLWLNDHHPNPDTERVRELLDSFRRIKADFERPLVVPAVKRRPMALATVIFVTLLLYTGWRDPQAYKRHGIALRQESEQIVQPVAKDQPNSKTNKNSNGKSSRTKQNPVPQ